MKKIKNNPSFGGKKVKITFDKTFETKIKSIKGGHIPPLPPCCARRACRLWLTSSNASLSTHGTTGAHPPPPSKEGEIDPTPAPPVGRGKSKNKNKSKSKSKGKSILKKTY